MDTRVYKVLPAQAALPDHITSNVRYSLDGTKKIVEFTQIPSNANPLLSHEEALTVVSGPDWAQQVP